jgi:hypothetical protein
MAFRQDSDPYCMLWLGLIILSSFIFNFIYLGFLMPASAVVIGSAFTLLGGVSILMVFLLIGYLRPEKGKGKNLMMSLSVLVGFFFVVFVDQFVNALPSAGTTLYLSAWGIGGSVLTAAGFSMMHTGDESYSPGIMDTSALHFGPEPEPETVDEVVPEPDTKSEEPAKTANDSSQTPNE